MKTSTKSLIVCATILLLVLLSAPLGYRFGDVPLQASFVSLLIGLAGGMLVVIVSLFFLIMAIRKGTVTDRNGVLAALVIGLVPALILLPQMLGGGAVPPIHDISTDPDNPPVFEAVVALRKEGENPITYGSGSMSAQDLAAAQQSAYPDIAPLDTELSVTEAVRRAASVLEEQGLEIVASSPESGIVEATATTFWFGFKDDVIVRITELETGSRIDVRSISRIGQSDLGVNAARISRFLDAF